MVTYLALYDLLAIDMPGFPNRCTDSSKGQPFPAATDQTEQSDFLIISETMAWPVC